MNEYEWIAGRIENKISPPIVKAITVYNDNPENRVVIYVGISPFQKYGIADMSQVERLAEKIAEVLNKEL